MVVKNNGTKMGVKRVVVDDGSGECSGVYAHAPPPPPPPPSRPFPPSPSSLYDYFTGGLHA
jgi:hypothetical protein